MVQTVIAPELQFITAQLKERLKTKPCDNIILIRHKYLVKCHADFNYDLFKFAYSNSDKILRLECSYFIEQLLSYLDLALPTQQKAKKIKTWELIHNNTFYDPDEGITSSEISKEKFFSLIGLCFYQHNFASSQFMLEDRKHGKIKMFPVIGQKCFDLIVDYLDDKYGAIYDAKGNLPAPKSSVVIDQTSEVFDNFLASRPKFTRKKSLKKHNLTYEISGLEPDFKSEYKATFQAAADFLVCDCLKLAGKKSGYLKNIKQHLNLDSEIITERVFYKMFALCCLEIASLSGEYLDSYKLRTLGRNCFLKLLEYLG
jgi:hypothetical protein